MPADSYETTVLDTKISALDSRVKSPACYSCSGLAVAGSLVSFMPEISAIHREDVLDSMLLASLSASKNHNRQDNPATWYRAYISVLEKIGWIMQANDTSTFSLCFNSMSSNTIVNLLFDGAERQVTQETMDALKKRLPFHAEKTEMPIFNAPATLNGTWNLLLSVAQAKNDSPTITLGEAKWLMDIDNKDYLSFHFFDARINGNKSIRRMVLNEATYGPIRAEIKKKLGNAIEKEITCLNANDYSVDH